METLQAILDLLGILVLGWLATAVMFRLMGGPIPWPYPLKLHLALQGAGVVTVRPQTNEVVDGVGARLQTDDDGTGRFLQRHPARPHRIQDLLLATGDQRPSRG